MRVLAVLAILTMPASAQDVVFSPAATEACLAATEDPETHRACVGQSARACMSDTPGGQSTYGMGACLSGETEYWDAQLNAIYAESVASARATDAEMAEIGATVASQEDALRDMQRAWIAFRDATCDYEYSQWGGGTGGGPAIAGCFMRMTGEQVLYLRSVRMGG